MKMVKMKFTQGTAIMAVIFLLVFAGTGWADYVYATTDYSTTTIGTISSGIVNKDVNSFSDGDPLLLTFTQDNVGKLAIVNSGVLKRVGLYNQSDIIHPIKEIKLGTTIKDAVFYNGFLYLLDLGNTGLENAKLYKLDGKSYSLLDTKELKGKGTEDGYTYNGYVIKEYNGKLYILLTYNASDPNTWTVTHKNGLLLEVAHDTLDYKEVCEVGKNATAMDIIGSKLYIVSMGGAQGEQGKTPAFEIVDVTTSVLTSGDIWGNGDNRILTKYDEPTSIVSVGNNKLYLAVKKTNSDWTYESAIYKLDVDASGGVSVSSKAFGQRTTARKARAASTSSVDEIYAYMSGGIDKLLYNAADKELVSTLSYYPYQFDIFDEPTAELKKTYDSSTLGGNAYCIVYCKDSPASAKTTVISSGDILSGDLATGTPTGFSFAKIDGAFYENKSNIVSLLPAEYDVSNLILLPALSADSTTATFKVTLPSDTSSSFELGKIYSDDSVREVRFFNSNESLTADGDYWVDGTTLSYVVNDNGKYDLERTEGKIFDPVFMAAKKTVDSSGSSGCGAVAYAPFALLFAVPLIFVRKRK